MVNFRWLRVQRETRDSGPGQQPSSGVSGLLVGDGGWGWGTQKSHLTCI